MSELKIVKVGAGPSTPPPPPTPKPTEGATRKHGPSHRHKQPKHGVLKGGKTARLRTKIQAVRDPAKSPPVRKSTLKILTEKGAEKRRTNIRKTIRTMSDAKVRDVLKKSGLRVSDKTPPEIARNILEGGMEAGMIVSG